MSTNENKNQPQSNDKAKEAPKDEKKADNSDKKPEYKGNNPGGQSSKK
ncbi:MAG: hypothetical protein PQ612_09065 [Rickettsiales bacterium]|nr:hypothetical protein [Pseudomonadota bacterium]MDA0967216.1 hypothetical protein [Pseudomonadota bacterium]MDG4544123.1 hypothetical protein [Rickettsiales bacterium]MDG4546304.1 hypothetical protein [Rickettsiales bacterium]MDG4548447.1 hypothetical protein [Rickettsiales bacterium]